MGGRRCWPGTPKVAHSHWLPAHLWMTASIVALTSNTTRDTGSPRKNARREAAACNQPRKASAARPNRPHVSTPKGTSTRPAGKKYSSIFPFSASDAAAPERAAASATMSAPPGCFTTTSISSSAKSSVPKAHKSCRPRLTTTTALAGGPVDPRFSAGVGTSVNSTPS